MIGADGFVSLAAPRWLADQDASLVLRDSTYDPGAQPFGPASSGFSSGTAAISRSAFAFSIASVNLGISDS